MSAGITRQNQGVGMNKGPQRNSKRNRRILEFYQESGEALSFELIARKFRVTRHVVAGIVFRHKHGGVNRTGTGRVGPGYYPDKSAWDTRGWQ